MRRGLYLRPRDNNKEQMMHTMFAAEFGAESTLHDDTAYAM